MEDIMKIVRSLEEFRLFIKGVSKTIKNEASKRKKGGFLSMLLETLAASMLGSELTRKGVLSEGAGVIRAGQDF